MPAERDHPLCPALDIQLHLPADGSFGEADAKALPAKPGVLAIEDDSSGTLALITTANLRRAALARLGPPPQEQPRSKKADLRGLARRILATTVGSAFEADWAYLQLARARMPHSYRHLLDRWQAWFIHCDPTERFPQWIKTGHPGTPPAGRAGNHIGPFGDKHAAHRFIEMLEDAFDLCRYHHILIQAPRGTACAYKEMGRCPAPCDGSVSMQQYLGQVCESIAFAQSPQNARRAMEERMRQHSAALDFESARRCKVALDRTAGADRAEFAHVRDLRNFRFLAVLPAERNGWARLMLINGGWIEPLADLSCETAPPDLADVVEKCSALPVREPDFGDVAIENIGLVCRHLLLPRAVAKRRRAEFLHLPDDTNPAALAKALMRIARGSPHETESESESAPAEQELEGV